MGWERGDTDLVPALPPKKSICYLFFKSIDFGDFFFFASPTPFQIGGPHLIMSLNDFSLLCSDYFTLRAGAGWSFFGGEGFPFWSLQKDVPYVLIACCSAHLGMRADQLGPTFN